MDVLVFVAWERERLLQFRVLHKSLASSHGSQHKRTPCFALPVSGPTIPPPATSLTACWFTSKPLGRFCQGDIPSGALLLAGRFVTTFYTGLSGLGCR